MNLIQIVRDRVKKAALLPEVELQPQQKRVVEKMQKEPALLAYHALGSGKTLSSLAAGEQIKGPKTVVVPAALRENYRKEVSKFTDQPAETPDYDILSYNKAVSKGLPEAGLTIFDEAHRIGREGTKASKFPLKAQGKVMFLTGTPVRNDPAEFVPLLKVLGQGRNPPGSHKAFREKFVEEVMVRPSWWQATWHGVKPGMVERLRNQGELHRLLKGRVDYHPLQGEFPRVDEQDVAVEMTPEQTKLYEAFLNEDSGLAYKIKKNLPPSKAESPRLNAFLSAVRQLSNNPTTFDKSMQGSAIAHSPKLRRMLGELYKGLATDANFKGVVYSNYLKSGILPLADALERKGIPHAVFTGGLKDSERREIVDNYNSGKVKILLVSGAGSEGLDLKGTKLMQLMEPHWNQARLDQMIGRAVRHRSHAHLPEAERTVKVQRFFSNPAPRLAQRWGLMDKDMGADEYMANLSDTKQQLISQFLDVLKKASGEHERLASKAAHVMNLPNGFNIPERLAKLVMKLPRIEKQSASDFAPGLPDPRRFGDVKQIPPGEVLKWVVQRHLAERAGPHYDVRFGREDGKPSLYSWATRKELPEPGGKIMLYQQPLHCFEHKTKVLTENGPVKIGKLVRDRKHVRVLSVDSEGKLVYRRVINFWSRQLDEPMVCLTVSGPFSRLRFLRCTLGHELYSFGYKVQAGKLKVGDSIDHLLPSPNADQQQILLGCLLGDGHVGSEGIFRFGHSDCYKDYFFWKVKALTPFFKTHVEGPRFGRFSDKPFHVAASVQGHPWFVQLRESYSAFGKQVTDAYLEQCGELALAVWYQDDGSILRSGTVFGGCSFATHGFNKDSIEALRRWLRQRFGLETFIVSRGVEDKQWEIRLNSSNALKLFSIICGYVHPSMRYKLELPEDWHTAICKGCGARIKAGMAVCDECLLDDVSGFSSSTKHRNAYSQGKTLVSPKTITNRCETWAGAKVGKMTLSSACEVVPSFESGSLLSLIDKEPSYGPVPLKIVRKTFSHKTCRVYDLEVEGTHRYVVKSGFVVSNSGQYAEFEGEIGEGYGKGTVKKHDYGNVIVTKAERDKIQFVVTHKKFPEFYTMVRMSGPPSQGSAQTRSKQGGSWLMINTTPMSAAKMLGGKPEEVGINKLKYGVVPADKVEKLFDPNYMIQEKVDGASALYHLMGDRIEALSYRISKTGRPIVYTYKIFGPGGAKLNLPKELQGTIVRGEVYGEREGKAIPMQELGGLLNASISNSLQKQREQKVQMKNMLFDVVRYGKEPIKPNTLTGEDRMAKLQEIMKHLPATKFRLPETARTPEEQKALYERIVSEQHPSTREGIVAWPATTPGRAIKVKPRPERDVWVQNVFPGKGKYEGAAGGFEYSLSPEGPIVGKVGGGFDDPTRKQMMEEAEDWKGRLARISAMERFPSGAYRAPSFLALHHDYPLAKTSAMLVKANLGRNKHEPERREGPVGGDQSLPRIAARRMRERHQRCG